MTNRLLLQTGGDIPFPEARITVHNPTMEEIGFIGEDSFHPGCQFLNFSIEDLSLEDKIDLEGKTDFDIFMSIMCSSDNLVYKNNAKMVLALLFPEYKINFSENIGIIFERESDNYKTCIDRHNYNTFKEILISMFCLAELSGKHGDYNPIDEKAKRIAEKLKKGHQKSNSQEENKEISIFSRYISILTVGQKKNVNDFNNYTVYQLMDEMRRFQLKQSYDMYVKAKMAGAQNVEEVDNWMDDIHS